ncbi:MAG: hypothetical protein K9J21_12400 [Bacteroidales bacterium]|nr:hypothetical protein [Bacteroidales bacterium]
MNLLIKQSVPLFIKIAVMMTSLYVVARNLPPVVGSFRFFWGPSALLWIFLVRSSAFKVKQMKYLFLYGVLSLGLLQFTIWQYMDDWHRSNILNEFYSIFIFFTIFCYYYIHRDYKGLASVAKWGFYFILITIFMTNIALYLDPMVVRQSASGEFATPFQAQVYRLTGATGYGYAQALVCLIPVLVYYIKTKSKEKRFVSNRHLIILLLLLFFTLVHAQVFANILAALAILALSIAGTERIGITSIMVVFSIIVILVIPASVYADMFYYLSSFFDTESNIHYKLTEIAHFIQYPSLDSTTAVGARAARYPYLFEQFISNPILGVASSSRMTSLFAYESAMWTHLYWMYRLTIWGLLGFGIFIFVLFQLFKKIYSIFDTEFKFYYLLSVSAFVFLGLMKNIAGREPYLMLIVIIPGMYFLPLLKHQRKRI